MSLANTTPLPFSATSVCDTLDSTNNRKGAMAALSNLIPDATTRNLFTCRPAAMPVTAFADFTSPGFVSVYKTLGTRIYGMIATGRNAGKDEPFCYDTKTNAFVAIGGVTNANTPASPATTGPWAPPTMDLIGVLLVVTHPGFNGAGGVMFGWFDLTNPTAPVWNGGNTGGSLALPSPPMAVKQFNSRAYYFINNSAVFSDPLNAINVDDATHVLIFGDSTSITAVGALPLNNQLGGIIQSLIAFKGGVIMYQITGDAAQGTLQVNAMNVATGTLAPNSICSTPKGLTFVAPDGVRTIDFNGNVSDPIGFAGDGVTAPFIFSSVPSRICAAYNVNVLRISTQNGNKQGQPNEEYWYDFARQIWTGPHSFSASLIQSFGSTFILTGIGINAELWQSDIVQSPTSTFVENGAQMTWDWKTSMLPNTQQMHENAMQETTIDMALSAGATAITAQCGDQNGTIFDNVSIPTTGGITIWGAFTWGQALWYGAVNGLAPQRLTWHFPIVFQRLFIEAFGNSAPGFKIGNMYMRYEKLGYLQQTAQGA